MKQIRYLVVVLLFFFSCSKNGDQLTLESNDCVKGSSTAKVLIDINEEVYNSDESVNAFSRYSSVSYTHLTLPTIE